MRRLMTRKLVKISQGVRRSKWRKAINEVLGEKGSSVNYKDFNQFAICKNQFTFAIQLTGFY